MSDLAPTAHRANSQYSETKQRPAGEACTTTTPQSHDAKRKLLHHHNTTIPRRTTMIARGVTRTATAAATRANCALLPSFYSSSSAAAADRARQQQHDPTRLLPRQYLRDADLSNYDCNTYQRKDVAYDHRSGRPIIKDDPAYTDNKKYQVLSWRHVDSSDDGLGGERVEITWADDVVTTYPTKWLEEQSRLYISGDGRPSFIPDVPVDRNGGIRRIPWSNLTEDDVRAPDSDMTISFEELIFGRTFADVNEGMDEAIEALYKYGILLVTDTPVHDGGTGVAALAAAISGGDIKTSKNVSLLARYRESAHQAETIVKEPVTVLPDGTDGPLRTLYGNVWSTQKTAMAEGASQADSAYSNDGLPLHTDMTYFREPPGLQIFAVEQPAVVGGESIFSDGLAVAERLRLKCPHSFHMLCKTNRRYRSIDTETGWHLEGQGPVISAVDRGCNLTPELRWGAITQIRHNDLDRLPDLPPLTVNGDGSGVVPMGKAEVDRWYSDLNSAHRELNFLLASDEFRLVMQLMPGDTIVVANQRCLHGRQRFQLHDKQARIVMGCYVSQEDVDSRFRRAGYQLPALL